MALLSVVMATAANVKHWQLNGEWLSGGEATGWTHTWSKRYGRDKEKGNVPGCWLSIASCRGEERCAAPLPWLQHPSVAMAPGLHGTGERASSAERKDSPLP